jgi:hypothetical protein
MEWPNFTFNLTPLPCHQLHYYLEGKGAGGTTLSRKSAFTTGYVTAPVDFTVVQYTRSTPCWVGYQMIPSDNSPPLFRPVILQFPQQEGV